jgi:hypothetical protein
VPHSTVVLLIWVAFAVAIMIVFTLRSGNWQRPLRLIPGLKAIEEAVGRSTELGRPLVFTTGWGGDIQRPTTLAALSLLKFVAAKAAAYGTRIIFPTHDPVIAETAREILRNAYAEQGHSDLYRDSDVVFVSPSQFGYAAGVDGIVTRSQPGALFLLGTFEGEALILAETGNMTGALQIAGTDSTIQLSFFIVACDYTLIGEELFTASAYLSDDGRLKSSMFAQDALRAVLLLLIVVLSLAAVFGLDWHKVLLP